MGLRTNIKTKRLSVSTYPCNGIFVTEVFDQYGNRISHYTSSSEYYAQRKHDHVVYELSK